MSDFTQAPPPPPGGGAPPPPPLGGGLPGGSTEKNNLGTWALVLGIVSFVCCGLVAAIPAIFLGLASRKAQAAGQANNGTLGTVGLVLGIANIVMSIVAIALYVFTDALAFAEVDLQFG